MTEPINFAAARAEKHSDGAMWTPRDCLAQLLADIDAGDTDPTKISIHMVTQNANGDWKLNFYQAGLSRPEHVALLTLALHDTVESWKI